VAGVVGLLLWSPWKQEKKVGGASAPRPLSSQEPGRGTEAAPTLAGLKENLTLDIGRGVTMDFVLIKPGTFMMGEDKSSHKVTITTPFYLGKFEVTQEQWQAIMGSNPSTFQGAKNPVEKVSWEGCQTLLRELQGKLPGRRFRLPTEAEWEYACRAGNAAKYCYGDDDARLSEYAWYDINSGSGTHPVGEKKPNAWGLYDMHGNVLEWCADWHGTYDSSAATDPVGPRTGSNRVLRGGSWRYSATLCQSANRNSSSPSSRSSTCGLRVVVEAR